MDNSEGVPARLASIHGVNHLALQGVVDLFAAADLRELALQCVESGRATVVACEQLERIDCSALQLLLMLEQHQRERGSEFTLLGVPGNVLHYLRLAGARSLL